MKLVTALVLGGFVVQACPVQAKGSQGTLPHVKRDVTQQQKQELFQKAGIPKSRQHLYVIDHIIPLELGGTNDLSNLQVQDLATAKRKDLVENFLRREVAAGRMTLQQAQQKIRHWQTVKVT